MIKTKWKPTEEIAYALKNVRRAVVLSCDGCADQCGTGGEKGLASLNSLLEEWGKDVTFAHVVEECCDESLMKRALSTAREAVENSDAIIVVSCATGVKSACLCLSDILVVATLDTVGGAVFSTQDNLITRSLCKVCEHCVLTFTGGICPVTACPSKNKYGPCKKAPTTGSQCAADTGQTCAWKEIGKRCEIKSLIALRSMHK